MSIEKKLVCDLSEVGLNDTGLVGGKNASLGEMIQNLKELDIKVPGGFVVTALAYREFIKSAKLDDFIRRTLESVNTHDVRDLAKRALTIRKAIKKAKLPKDLQKEVETAYKELEGRRGKNTDVAVRSSATAEDLPGASFAGEHETYLGIRGIKNVLDAIKSAMASLFTDRAISYRVDKKFDHFKIALSVTVQEMVRSDLGTSGVMFTIDTESGFKNSIIINSAYGLGELVVQGKVSPDEFVVDKRFLDGDLMPIIDKNLGAKGDKMIYSSGTSGIRPLKVVRNTSKDSNVFSLSDAEIIKLAKWGLAIERHYSRVRNEWTPMDMEWAKDGKTGELFIVQARPETVHAMRDLTIVKEYVRKQKGEEIVAGVSVGSKIAVGRAHVILSPKDIHKFKAGEVLITDITDPDWEPIMKIASAIVTDKGGRTSHATIVSRELGIPAVVGTGNASKKIKTGDEITVDTTGSNGVVLKGKLAFEVRENRLGEIPKIKTKIMMNIGTPETAFEKSFLPNSGVGLAREEFIISSVIGVHPNAILDYKKLDAKLKKKIDEKSLGWENKKDFYVDNLAFGIGRIASAFYPKPVVVRFSDFKTNEYRTLIGGELYEPEEENPMLGWRGASRYYDPEFKEAFVLECLAFKKVIEEMGLVNVIPMVPFCRTVEEGTRTLKIMQEAGLEARYFNKEKGIPIYVMCEIPSNVLLADEFLDVFDGMSIGSNDLTQLVLGLDRDSGIINHISNELDEAVKKMVKTVVEVCKRRGKYIGICGQAPSDHPEFAEFLVQIGIDSMSLNPDTVIQNIKRVYEQEKKLGIN